MADGTYEKSLYQYSEESSPKVSQKNYLSYASSKVLEDPIKLIHKRLGSAQIRRLQS